MYENSGFHQHFHFFQKNVIKSVQNLENRKENEFLKSEKHGFLGILASNQQLFWDQTRCVF